MLANILCRQTDMQGSFYSCGRTWQWT